MAEKRPVVDPVALQKVLDAAKIPKKHAEKLMKANQEGGEEVHGAAEPVVVRMGKL